MNTQVFFTKHQTVININYMCSTDDVILQKYWLTGFYSLKVFTLSLILMFSSLLFSFISMLTTILYWHRN